VALGRGPGRLGQARREGPPRCRLTLSPRDAAALRALHELQDDEHVVRAPLGALLRASGLSQTTWQARAIPSLRGQRLVETWLEPFGPKGHYQVMRFKLTPDGISVATRLVAASATTPPETAPGSSRCRTGVVSGAPSCSSSNLNPGKKNQQKATTPEDDTGDRTGVVSDLTTALQVALGVIEEQGQMMKALAAHIGVSMERCGCGELKVPIKKRDGSTFLGCPQYETCPSAKGKAAARAARKLSSQAHRSDRKDATTMDIAEIKKRLVVPPRSPEAKIETRGKTA
jgi:hypothetical protein